MNKNYLAPFFSLIKWKDSLVGDLVELLGDEGEWYEVTHESEDRIEVVSTTSKLPLPPREIVNKKFILRIK